MADTEYPVVVAVDRGGGRVEEVRVGTAVRNADGFVLRLFELRIKTGAGASASAPAWGAPTPPARGAGPHTDGMVFPNYGRSKGQPIAGASMQDLEYYAAGCRRSLADPGKARWHDKERVLLAAIEAEMIRQRGMPPMEPEGGYWGGDGGGAGRLDDERPPPDDDVPF